MYSLDAMDAPSMTQLPRNFKNSIATSSSPAKPFGASRNDEYSIVQQTSEDFINLRRALVLSPLFNRSPLGAQELFGGVPEIQFKGSIFHQILADKAKNSSSYNDFAGTIKESLIQGDEKSELSNQADHASASLRSSPQDSWDRFNTLLLRFLNNYSRQVRAIGNDYPDGVQTTREFKSDTKDKQGRRSSRGEFSTNDDSTGATRSNEGLANTGTANLLTFACMAKDGNPISNLSFSWMFGLNALPEVGNAENSLLPPDIQLTSGQPTSSSGGLHLVPAKPVLLYANENSSLHVILVRRLDTRLSLSPFQLSLVTLNVVVGPSSGLTSRPMLSESEEAQTHLDKTAFTRAPVIKNRFQPSLAAVKPDNLGGNFDNIQFSNDFEMKSHSSFQSTPSAMLHGLTAFNWQEQLGNLLKCTITNQIGSSDVCHARVNIAQRSRGKATELSEYAKWRMPSLSNKSLLIISILLGCTLILFATTALLFGPQLRGLHSKKDAPEGGSEGTNTGQSTSSQKSSVLGLLGAGDSSLQASSDDDGSARLNNQDSNTCGIDLGSISVTGQLMAERASRPIQAYHLHQAEINSFSTQIKGSNYDRPRFALSQELHNCPQEGSFNEATPDRNLGHSADHYNRVVPSCQTTDMLTQSIRSSFNAKESFSSAGSRLLANLGLKSLTKFKVDRISDVSNFSAKAHQMRNLHAKTISNSETITTGLSSSVLDSEQSLKLTSPAPSNSPIFFASPNELRRSYTGVKRSNYLGQTVNTSSILNTYRSDHSNYQKQRDDLITNHLMDMGPRSYLSTDLTRSLMPTYSNLPESGMNNPRDAMEEFIKSRDPDYQLAHQPQVHPHAFMRSQSAKNHSYLPRNDLNSNYPNQISVGPPVYPRNHQLSAIYKPAVGDLLSQAALARVSQHQTHNQRSTVDVDCHYNQPVSSRFSVHNYGQAYEINQLMIPVTSSYSASGSLNQNQNSLNYAPMSLSLGNYSNQNVHLTYASTINPPTRNHTSSGQPAYIEHIYDVNAYATPDQSPFKAATNRQNNQQDEKPETSERPRVSQLIHTFNSQLPHNSGES